jgi:hypothetical protein
MDGAGGLPLLVYHPGAGAGWLIPISMQFRDICDDCGRIKFVLLAFFLPMGLACTMQPLPYQFERRGVVVMAAVTIYVFAVFPLGTALAGDVMAGVPSWFDSSGICRQYVVYRTRGGVAARCIGWGGCDRRADGAKASCPYQNRL